MEEGICSKDGLIIKSGIIALNAMDDGIMGKDYLVIKDGDITVDARGDGIYEDGTYTSGTRYTSFTVSGTVTNVN